MTNCKKGYYEKNGICISNRNKKLIIGNILFGIIAVLAGILLFQQLNSGAILTSEGGVLVLYLIGIGVIAVGIWSFVEIAFKDTDYEVKVET